ncbi:MAG TPA: hypothetical protein VHA52_10035 [Candidatus Babeliaceae bacterium]|nr:hypothetical protein [Candidatus Babeliaceae bacterium]
MFFINYLPSFDSPFIDSSLQEEVGNTLPFSPQPVNDFHFHENLAELLPEDELEFIASQLIDAIEEDISSRSDWKSTYTKAIKLCGLKLQNFQSEPYVNACKANDSTLIESVLTSQAIERAELFPNSGPCAIDILGNPNSQIENEAYAVGKWMNHYLTTIDKEYYSDSDRMLMYVNLVGCGFKKVYLDPILKRPIARFIDPDDFIINNDAVSILSSDRLTHVLYLNKREIMMRQEEGVYRDVDLENSQADGLKGPDSKEANRIDGISLDVYEKRSLYRLYEVHTNLVLSNIRNQKDDLKGPLPLPYIVTLCPSSHKILSIRRNWEEGDPTFRREEYFVNHTFLPSFGIYGLGYSHLLGSNSIVLTEIIRSLIDAAGFENYPAGFCASGLRIDDNTIPLQKGEWRPVGSALSPRDSFFPLPYKGPSPALLELRKEVLAQTMRLASIAQQPIAEGAQNAPVGTTLALLERQNVLMSASLRSLHCSLTHELQLIYKLFQKDFPETPFQFNVKGESLELSRQSFRDTFRLIPVSDPTVSTSTQRIIRAQATLDLALKAPQLHDMREVFKNVYAAMKVDNIDEILPPTNQAVPLDPINENMNITLGKPVVTAIWQDHRAHLMVHQSDPQVANSPAGQAHIREHLAQDYLVRMEQLMGTQLPPLDQMQDPQVQNQIAVMAANASLELLKQQNASNPQPVDPNQVMLADIAQRREATQAKKEETLLKTETEANKAMLRFESEQNKLETQERIAREKNETELKVESLKHKEVL